jgi:hypothetical protein
MSKTESEQKSVLVRQHARLAMGEKLTGQSMKSGGGNGSKPQGGLAQAKKK